MTKQLSADRGYDHTLGASLVDEYTIDGIHSSRNWTSAGLLDTQINRRIIELVPDVPIWCVEGGDHDRCLAGDSYRWTPEWVIFP